MVAVRKPKTWSSQGGLSTSPEYSSWKNMVGRCRNPTHVRYATYGAHGITVVDEWVGPGGFTKFLACVGRKPDPTYTIDRIDNAKGYEPGNVRWASKKTQSRNRSDNRKLTVKGETLTLAEWAERTGLSLPLIRQRIDLYGWSIEAAVLTPAAPPSEATSNGWITRRRKYGQNGRRWSDH